MAQDGFDADVSGSSDRSDAESVEAAQQSDTLSAAVECRLRGTRLEVSFATAREPARRLLLATVTLLALATRLHNIDIPAAVSFAITVLSRAQPPQMGRDALWQVCQRVHRAPLLLRCAPAAGQGDL